MSLFAKEILYLGHILSTTGMKPVPSTMEAFESWNHQETPHKYGLPWYHGIYHRFIKTFAYMAKPSTTLMWHNAKFTWTQVHQAVFKTIKGKLIKAPITSLPRLLKVLYSVHRCSRWHPWNSVVLWMWQVGIACCFFHIPSQKLNKNEVSPNRKLMEYTTP